VIDLLDRTLETLLTQQLPGVHVYFDAPGGTFGPNLPAVDLFLYDLREDRERRSGEWLTERRASGMVARVPPPVRIACSYLITAWAGEARDEHRLLGQVLAVLLRFPTLPDALLPEGLQGQEPPLPTSVLQPGQLQSMGEFWQALGGKPKAALTYTVTIGIPPAPPVEGGPAVTDVVTNRA
jgi:hypothetical protein